jgi:hypothetical protein
MGDAIPLAPIAITAASFAIPIVITTATPHGVVDVTYGSVAGVLGNLAANGGWVAERLTATTLKLRNSSGSGAYTSGGTFTPLDTFTKVAEMRNLTPIGFTFRMEDVSAHDGSGWASSIPTHKVGPSMRLDINLVLAHATHDKLTGLLYVALNKIRRDWLVVFPDAGKTAVFFDAWVSDWGSATPVGGVLSAAPMVTVDGEMFWAAP